MKVNRKPEVPVDDYSIENAQEIVFRGMPFLIMPRYQEHFISKDYEPFSMALVQNYVAEGMKVIDIGAHMGAFSVVMSKNVGKEGAVYSYEPVPENRELLARNLAMNQFSTDNVRDSAISDVDGRDTFNIPWASDSAGFFEHPNAETVRKLDVEVRSLDSLHSKDKVDLIKIDTEGNEIRVLRGAARTLRNNPQVRMLIEFNPECLESAGVKDASEFFTVLHGLGFRTLVVDEQNWRFDEVKDPRAWQVAMRNKEYANVYCVPQGTKVAIVGLHTAQFGGGEIVALEGAVVLRDEGYVITCVLPEQGPMVDRLRDHGFATEVVPYMPWCRVGDIDPADLSNENRRNTEAVMILDEILERTGYDVGISHTLTQPWLAIACAGRRIPHVWALHEFGTKGVAYKFDYPIETIIHIINDLTLRILVFSHAMSDHMKELGIDQEKLTYCPLGINVGVAKRKDKYSSKALAFAIVGTLTSHKNQLMVVDAIHEARKATDQPITLSIIGTGDEKYVNKIRSLIKKHRLHDSVKLLGYRDDARELLLDHDALIIATSHEPFGRVSAEAILMGLPVVGFDSDGTKEIIHHGTDGLLYSPNTYTALAKSIATLATDSKMYGHLVSGVLKSDVRRKYTMERFAETFLRTIEGALVESVGITYFYDKFFPPIRSIRRDDQLKIAERDAIIQDNEKRMDIMHNDILVQNHRIQQLRSRLVNKSALRYWYDRVRHHL